MKKRLVMGTLTAALIAGSVPYEIYAQQEEVVIQSEEEGQEEPSEPEQPEPAPSEEPQPTMEPEPTQAPEPTVEPEPTQAPAPTETPEEPTATPVPEPTTAPTQTPAPTETPQPTVTPTPALVSVGLKVEPGDASVVLLDAEGNPVSAEENGRYSLLQGQAYELYVRKEGYQEVYQKITADPAVTEYTITLLSGNTALKGLYVSSSDKYGKGILKLSPDLAPDKEKFEASYDGERQSLNIWPEVEDEKASIKVYAISGIKAGTVEKDETITGTKDNKDRLYWKIFFADQEKVAKVRLEVTAEDGTTRDYYITLKLTDTTAPVLKKISASRISTDTASAVYKTSEKGTCYYQVIEAGEKVPSLDTGGEGTEVLAGTNTITLTGLSSGEKDLVIVVKDAAGNVSDSLVMGIPDIKTAGTPGNLVHGSDHGGNKSQATIPGQSGEGSLSNLKLVEGTKAGGKEGEKTTGEIRASLKLQGEKQTSLFGNMKTADIKKNESPKWTDRTGKKYAKDLKPGYTIAGEKVVEKVTPSPVVEEKSEASDRFTEETKTTVTNTTGKNQAQEESFAGSVTRGIKKASLATKFLLVIAVLETGFAVFFVTAKKRFKKRNKKKPKITA